MGAFLDICSCLKSDDKPPKPSKYQELRNSNLHRLSAGPCKSPTKKLTVNDFEMIQRIGEGTYGTVLLVRAKFNRKTYAMKKLKKSKVLKEDLIESTFTERDILLNADHPFVVSMKYSFQSLTELYMVMEYLPGGELFTHIRKQGHFDEDTTRFYAAEVIIAIQYLHDDLDVMYRDLKPENILLDADGHIKITDFGLAKAKQKANDVAGTPEYLAPEIIQRKGHHKQVDWWTLGCLMYEMMDGRPPFGGSTINILRNNIVCNEPEIPPHFSKNARDLITRLLEKNPTQRLGAGGAEEIRQHSFFKGLDWDRLSAKRLYPPIRPKIDGDEDTNHFDVPQNLLRDEPTDSALVNKNPNAFAGFTYQGSLVLNHMSPK